MRSIPPFLNTVCSPSRPIAEKHPDAPTPVVDDVLILYPIVIEDSLIEGRSGMCFGASYAGAHNPGNEHAAVAPSMSEPRSTYRGSPARPTLR
jgi:hypothetical protein